MTGTMASGGVKRNMHIGPGHTRMVPKSFRKDPQPWGEDFSFESERLSAAILSNTTKDTRAIKEGAHGWCRRRIAHPVISSPSRIGRSRFTTIDIASSTTKHNADYVVQISHMLELTDMARCKYSLVR